MTLLLDVNWYCRAILSRFLGSETSCTALGVALVLPTWRSSPLTEANLIVWLNLSLYLSIVWLRCPIELLNLSLNFSCFLFYLSMKEFFYLGWIVWPIWACVAGCSSVCWVLARRRLKSATISSASVMIKSSPFWSLILPWWCEWPVPYPPWVPTLFKSDWIPWLWYLFLGIKEFYDGYLASLPSLGAPFSSPALVTLEDFVPSYLSSS